MYYYVTAKTHSSYLSPITKVAKSKTRIGNLTLRFGRCLKWRVTQKVWIAAKNSLKTTPLTITQLLSLMDY